MSSGHYLDIKFVGKDPPTIGSRRLSMEGILGVSLICQSNFDRGFIFVESL